MQKILAIFAICLTSVIMSGYGLLSKTAEYYFNEGEKSYQQNEFSKSIRSYTKAIGLKPDYLRAYYKRGLSRVQLDSNNLAIEDFTVIINITPNGESYYHRACAKIELKDSVGACSDFESSCDLMVNRACDIYSRICRK